MRERGGEKGGEEGGKKREGEGERERERKGERGKERQRKRGREGEKGGQIDRNRQELHKSPRNETRVLTCGLSL